MLSAGCWKKHDGAYCCAADSFQPELRRALEQIGRGRLFRKHGELDEYEVDEMVNSITSAAIVMGRRKIGALIVIEREIGLEERIETGVAIDGLISDSLLLNILKRYPAA